MISSSSRASCWPSNPWSRLGTKEVRTLDDGWTVETKDRRFSAHFEHTVAMTPEGPRVLTYLED